MRITPAEERLIRQIAPTLQDIAVDRLSSQYWAFASDKPQHANRFAVALVNLARFILLLAEVAAARLQPRRSTEATIFYEDQQAYLSLRLRHLEVSRPEVTFYGISYGDRIQRFPITGEIIGLTLNLLAAIIGSIMYRPSALTPSIVRAVRILFLTYSAALNSKNREMYLFRIYRPEMAMVSAFLSAHDIGVHLVASNTPLSIYNRVMIGSSIKVAHTYQVDEFRHYCSKGTCHWCDLWPTEKYAEYRRLYGDQRPDDLPGVVGVYTEGFLLRQQLGQLAEAFAAQAVRCEAELLQSVVRYASDNPDVRMIIFPHPMERRYAKSTGTQLYEELLGLPNIELADLDSQDSTGQFSSVGLGLTTLSSVGFERIQLGFRSLFYVAHLSYVNWTVKSQYHRLFLKDQDSLLKVCSEYRRLTHREFMMQIFGAEQSSNNGASC